MQDQYVDVGSTSIRYRDTGGDGPPVLLTHGIGLSLEFWDHQLTGLGKDVRLVAWDMPGHGLSDAGDQPYEPDSFAEFAWRFVDAVGIERLYLAGNSLGAAVSFRMASLAPERVKGIVSASSASLGHESPIPFRIMTLRGIGELLSRPSKSAGKRQLTALFHDEAAVTDDLRRVVDRNLAKPGGDGAFLATLRLMTNFRGQRPEMWQRSRSILGSLQCPVLFVHGNQDAVVPAQHSVDAHGMTPGSELLLLDDCGHVPQFEKPAEFGRALLGFVTR